MKKSKKTIGMIAGSIVAVIAIALGVFFGTANMRAYSSAEKTLEEANYTEAANQFEALGDYKDAQDRAKGATYQYAQSLMDTGVYTDAAEVFSGLGDYQDAFEKANEARYLNAKTVMESKEYETAHQLFADLGDYSDASHMADECIYLAAVEKYDAGELTSAIELLETVPEYEKAATLLLSYKYELAGQYYAAEEFAEAERIYTEILGYEDSEILANQSAYYQTVDGQFMLSIAKGLQARWVLSEETTDPSEFSKLIDAELAEIEPYYEENFDSKRLGEIAESYIDTLMESKDATRYYNNNYMVYETKWNTARAARLHLIEELVNDFNLTVDEEYQDTLDELVNDSRVYSEQEAFEAELESIVEAASLSVYPYRSDYDNEILWYDYYLSITNTTAQTLEYLSIDIQVLDGDGNIFLQGDAYFSNVEPGQSSVVQVYLSSDQYDYSGYTIKYVLSNYGTELYYG